MANITVTLTDTQTKSLEYAAYSVQDWCDNAIHNRARVAQEEIISKLVAHCNANDVAIATGVDAQVTQAYSLGVVDTAKNIEDSREDSDTP
jgi:hypothetical protein|tara:strand:+ start:783 stop:1055 length:273 start_codon:yes stop_codon:yes gene_type:complete